MTTEMTVHDRVMQAVQRDRELANQLISFKATLLEAKQAEDEVRKSTTFKEHAAGLEAARDMAIAAAKADYDDAVAKATIPFEAAKAKYEAALQKAHGPFSKASEDAKAEYEAALTRATRERELALAEARATVHRIEQEIAAHRTTIDQHRRNIQDRLGLNLGNLMGV